jgi:hypothetical protein
MNGAMLVASQKFARLRCLVILMARKRNGLRYHVTHTDLQGHLSALAYGSEACAIRKADHKGLSKSGIKFMGTQKKSWLLKKLKFNQSSNLYKIT